MPGERDRAAAVGSNGQYEPHRWVSGRQGYRRGHNKTPHLRGFSRAQLRTRTGDPFLTMEVLYQLS
jgi:hypothetical protein